MKTKHGLNAKSIAHKIEIENNGYSLDMIAAIEDHHQNSIEDQDWAKETSTFTFEDGSKLAFNGPTFERIEPAEK